MNGDLPTLTETPMLSGRLSGYEPDNSAAVPLTAGSHSPTDHPITTQSPTLELACFVEHTSTDSNNDKDRLIRSEVNYR